MRGPFDQGKVKPSKRSKGNQAKNKCRIRVPVTETENTKLFFIMEISLMK